MLLCNQKKLFIKRKIEQRWKKAIHLVYTLRLILNKRAFFEVPLEIIPLVHVQSEKFTFTIAHSFSNISLDAYSYLKCDKKRTILLKIQFYFIFHFRAAELWYKMVLFTQIFKNMKAISQPGWPGFLLLLYIPHKLILTFSIT